MLQLIDGKRVDRIPVCYTAACPEGHEGAGTLQFDLPPDAVTIESFREAAEATCASLEQRCPTCRAPILAESLRRFFAFYEFEDECGTVVAWYGPTVSGRSWVFGYVEETSAEALMKKAPKTVDDLTPTLYGGMKNEDCRGALGRVFSLRNRWPELVSQYIARGRTILFEMVAPGYGAFVVRRDCTAQVRALARVSVPEYRPDQTHVHARVDPSWLPRAVVDVIREQDVVLEAVIDTDWVTDHIDRIGARLGRDGSGLDPRKVAADAAARGRMLGEQVMAALTSPRA